MNNFFVTSRWLLLLASMVCLLQQCRPVLPDDVTANNGSMSTIQVKPGFNFATTSDVAFRVKVLTNKDKPMAGVPLSLYGMPGDLLLMTGITQADGTLSMQHSIGSNISSVDIRTAFPGIPNSYTVAISNAKSVDVVLGGSKPSSSGGRQGAFFSSETMNEMLLTTALPTLATLGTWNSLGVPNYLVGTDAIDTQFYQDISASLPEGAALSKSHPSYLYNSAPTTLNIRERADVWVTFVHEGAGWQNTLGYYTYDANNPPQSVNDLKNLTVIFPNVSYTNSGGGLVSGNRVKIGTFEAGTQVGFFLIGDAFRNGKIGNGYYAHFSHSALNVEKDPNNRRHIILLDDPRSNRFLLGIEDVSHENVPINCDNDYNDAVFYITSNPITAIDPSAMPKMDTQKDSDGDGASDSVDEYPTDKDRAFNSYTPAKNAFGTLAYEDLWPQQGDYDFNDLVVSYNFQEVLNASSKVVDVKAHMVPRAIGASMSNGWGFELPVASTLITSVTGNRVRGKSVTLGSNGVETGSTKAIVVAFENAFDCLPRPGTSFVNTVPGETQSVGDTMHVTVKLNTPQAASQWLSPPYNSFLIVNQDRGREIHFIDNKPTARANVSLFGTMQDRSSMQGASFYKNERGLPWALNLPVSFDYPVERAQMTDAYLYFKPWAESGGTLYTDWYQNKPGYRNQTNIYKK